MPFSYDDQQLAFIETVRTVLARHGTISAARAVLDAPERWTEIWEQLVTLDLLALLVPESAEGLGLSAVDMVAIVEAAGHFGAPVPFAMTVGAFTPMTIAAGIDPEKTNAILAEVITGSAGTIAPTLSCASAGVPSAVLSGSTLTAHCAAIPEASRAALVGVPSRREEDDAIVLVIGSPTALGIEMRPGMDPASPVGILNGGAVDVAGLIVLEGDPRPALPLAWTAAAAELVGLASELVDVSVRHACDRVQFGRPIGAFQGVKHRLVDAHLAVERARSLTRYAAVLASEGAPIVRAAHRAKAAASEAADTAARAAVQVHGGAGITVEHDVSLLYLKARQQSILLGGPDEHYGCICTG